MNKKQILDQIRNDVYCRLMPSKISGVGIFAVRDIPAGIDPFKEPDDIKWIPFSKKELEDAHLHPNVLRIIKDLFVFSEGVYWVPESGVYTLCIVQYLNHSQNPNLVSDKDGEIIRTKREIKEGEELTIDYRIFYGGKIRF